MQKFYILFPKLIVKICKNFTPKQSIIYQSQPFINYVIEIGEV